MRSATTLSVLLAFTVIAQPVWAREPEPLRSVVRGIYGNPQSFWDRGARLDEYGINAIFVYSGSIDEKLMQRARSEGAGVYAEFATLNGKDYVEEHPEAWPIDDTGERVEQATWFLGACPTEPGFRQYRMMQLRELLRAYDIDGVWMDYLHWHAQFEDPNPILPETCFCPHCLASFQTSTGIEVPDGTTGERAQWVLEHHDRAWRDWRCAVLVGWARDMKRVIREERPGALLGNFQCPWSDEEFDRARRRILGLDLDQLAEVVDVFSPMVYHGRMGRPATWVQEYIEWFCTRLSIRRDGSPAVWPIVQAHDDPDVIPAKEFEQVLRLGISSEATGVMMFSIHSVAESDGKMAVLRSVYREWMRRTSAIRKDGK